MKQYIGTKMVQAEPAWRVTTLDDRKFVMLKREPGGFSGTIEDGYKVVYPDGYESWSPKDVFDAAYRPIDGMNFGLAIEAAKLGKRIARAGWNGKNQYVELGVNFSYYAPSGICEETHHQDIGSTALVFVGTRGRQVGWLASQADMLADDWRIVE